MVEFNVSLSLSGQVDVVAATCCEQLAAIAVYAVVRRPVGGRRCRVGRSSGPFHRAAKRLGRESPRARGRSLLVFAEVRRFQHVALRARFRPDGLSCDMSDSMRRVWVDRVGDSWWGQLITGVTLHAGPEPTTLQVRAVEKSVTADAEERN
jgi:hypothetical protein